MIESTLENTGNVPVDAPVLVVGSARLSTRHTTGPKPRDACRSLPRSTGRIGWVASGVFHLSALVVLALQGTPQVERRVSLAGSRLVISMEMAASRPSPPIEPTATQSETQPTQQRPPQDDVAPAAQPTVELPARAAAEIRPASDASKPVEVVRSDNSPRPEISPRHTPTRPGQTADGARRAPARPRATSSTAPSVAAAATMPTVIGLEEQTAAQPLDNPHPEYPAAAIERKWSGRVLLRLSISVAGHVSAVEIAQSSGYRLLDEAAAKAVRRWRFSPARRGGRAVASSALLPVRFRAE